jgi:Tol biopolymer transport system component
MRVPISGGSPELLLDAGVDYVGIACAKRPPSTLCLVARRDQKGVALSAFDLSTRQSRELAKVEDAAAWDSFYDGSRIAVLIKDQDKSRIRIVRSSGEMESEFILEQSGVRFITCSPDGKGLYLSVMYPGVAALYYTDLRGQARMLWQQKGRFALSGRLRLSPDGRYLAMAGTTIAGDAWLLENF